MKNKLRKYYSIKHILNKNLKAIVDPVDSRIKLYPVYVQLIYSRKNYLFKSIVKTYLTAMNFISKDDIELMAFERDFLSSIIEFEIEQKQDNFDVPGFSDKYEKYKRSVISEAEILLIGRIECVIKSKKSKFKQVFNYKYEPGKYQLLLEITRILVPEVRENVEFKTCELAEILWGFYKKSFPRTERYGLIFPTLFEWFKGGHKKVMNDFIESSFKGNETRLLVSYLDEFDYLMKAQIEIG